MEPKTDHLRPNETLEEAEKRLDRYVDIVMWARARYTVGGLLEIQRGGEPSVYTRIERAAFKRYVA